MDHRPLETIRVPPDAAIVEAVRAIDRGTMGIALVMDEKRQLLGTVTDGDIRRALLRGIGTDQPVTVVMNDKPMVVTPDTSDDAVLSKMLFSKLEQIPVIDENGCVVGMCLLADLVRRRQLPNTVVVFAGGFGTRLGTMTEDTPKPLLPLGPGNKPILDVILGHLRSDGFVNVVLAVHYRAEQIIERYGDGEGLGLRISYVKEAEPLGTAGALSQVEGPFEGPLLAMNGDVVSTAHFSDLLEFHRAGGFRATVAVRDVSFRVPYGVVEFDEGGLARIVEKPEQSFSVNAGIYVIDSELLDLIPSNQDFDMTDLFARALERKERLGAFPLAGSWHDIGKPEDLRRARDEFGGGS